MDALQAKELLQRYIAGEASSEESLIVESWYDQLVSEGEWKWGEGEKQALQAAMENRLLEKIKGDIAPIHHIRPARGYAWVIAAASILLMCGAGAYFLFFRSTEKPTNTIAIGTPSNDVKAPAKNRATITLASGQKVFLDSAANGTLATQGNIQIKKSGDGIIAYNGNEQPKNELVYNTLTNPRGSKVIDITLSDGTQVWLNAESSLKYPVAFAGNERKVEITGEAYFDVAHDKTKPFTVSKGNKQVQVLGTHFNINAYDDEKDMKVTLLEGSVKILNGDEREVIKPGQQAQVSDKIKIINGIDTALVMAWKNGIFLFDKTDVQLTMNQVARWYDVDIEYQGNVTGSFSGTIKRQENASQVLKMLALTGEVQFKIEGKKITVMP